jgi:uncharacterized protein YodC (DUF2158 family)
MSTLPKRLSIVAAFVLPLSMSPLAALPALASPAPSVEAGIPSAFRQGDLVRLRSGGPLMTVDRIEGDKVNCFWTDLSGQPSDGSFPASVLQKD